MCSDKKPTWRRTILLCLAGIIFSHRNYFHWYWKLETSYVSVCVVQRSSFDCGSENPIHKIFQNLKWKCYAENLWLHYEYSIILILNWFKIRSIYCEPYACHIQPFTYALHCIDELKSLTDFCHWCWRGRKWGQWSTHRKIDSAITCQPNVHLPDIIISIRLLLLLLKRQQHQLFTVFAKFYSSSFCNTFGCFYAIDMI